MLAAKLDEFGKPAWIALIVVAFWVWWPMGLAILAFSIWSGRMGCGHNGDRWQRKMERMQARMDHFRGRMEGRPDGGGRPHWGGGFRPSGNRAFDDYRAETLRRLEDEQQEFKDYLERLRFAKDKTEFDQFMAERRNRGPVEPRNDAPPAHQ
jgi:hypothetical protein